MKKNIAYTLTPNIAELLPFCVFIILQIPVPLTTVMVLIIALGTDMAPAIALAYENPEANIMKRKPRNAKYDHLVGLKILGHAYLQMGFLENLAGFYAYLVVLNDYGIKPATLIGLTTKLGIEPALGDSYDPLGGPCKGNSNCLLGLETRRLDMATNRDGWFDMRLFYYDFDPDKWTDCKFANYGSFFKQSPFVKHNGVRDPICYSSEAIKYAQCAFLVAVTNAQIMNLLVCKTRSLSIAQQGLFGNRVIYYGILIECLVITICCYVPYLNTGLGC